MGTRNLTMVVLNGEYKVAQYGQWDGYPEGNGAVILDFLRNVDLEKFKASVAKTRYITDDDINDIDERYPKGGWQKEYPQFSRDMGADILKWVYNGGEVLRNSKSFAGDSLFCEWAYLIDLDSEELEVYVGFNRDEVTEGRFLSSDKELEITDGYHPIILLKKYSISGLPSDEVFYEDLNVNEEED